MPRSPHEDSSSQFLVVEDPPISVRIVRSDRATRLTLRHDVKNGGFRLTMPPGISKGEAEAMVRRHSGWLTRQLKRIPERIAFEPGATVPVTGHPRQIHHHPEFGHRVTMTADSLATGGDIRHVPRRIEDFLRNLARQKLADFVHIHAHQLGKPVSRVTVRDTVSRWGSCSARGRISLSWRLVLAPEWVASYVAAHEVAHLAEMNHGPRFWQVCRTLFPDTDSARAWLRRHGADLHRYGGGTGRTEPS